MKGRSLCIMCHSVLLVCMYLFCINFVISTTSKTCNNMGTFQQILDISLPLCAEECFRRQRCQIFMFRHGMNYCALKDQVNLSSLNENGALCVYHTRDDWSPVFLGSCSEHDCNGTERCKSKTDTEFECVKSECPLPEKIPNAILVSTTHTVGTTNKYKCINGHAGLGNSTITCNEDAKWSVTNFRCTKCPAPNQTYFNADLTAVKGNGYTPGTELTFTCKDGYRKTNEVKSICQNSSMWEPEDIRCCHENSTTYINGRCMAEVGSGIASEYDEADKHCKIMGGKFRWVSKELSKLFSNASTRDVLQSRKMKWFDNENNWNYSKCAADNGEVAAPNITLKEKITNVQNHNWNTKSCYLGMIWADWQPNNPGKKCVIFSLQDYKHHDSPCSFLNISFACRFNSPPTI